MRRWPEEVITWLRENVPGRTTKQVTELINRQGFDKKYGMVFSDATIKGAKNRYGIKSGTACGWPKGYSLKYPEGMESYIWSIAPGRTTKEIAELVAAHFDIEFSESQCRTYKKNHNIITGLDCRFKKGHIPVNKGKPMSKEQYEKSSATMFKKGHVPANHMKVGEYTHTTDGYLLRKVKETGPQWDRFEFVHRAVWEKHNGPIPEDKMVSFLDGDKDNCDINNLVLIDNEENLEMNRSKLRFADPERTKTGVLIARTRVVARNKKAKTVRRDNHG